jgi:hypothetical protein
MRFKPYKTELVRGGTQKVYRFKNGFGASVVSHNFSYGGKEGKWELAVIKFKMEGFEDFKLTYSTPITDDVIGWLELNEVDNLLEKISKLEKVE